MSSASSVPSTGSGEILLLPLWLHTRDRRRIRRLLALNSVQDAAFALRLLPLSLCKWVPSTDALQLGMHDVHVAALGTISGCHVARRPLFFKAWVMNEKDLSLTSPGYAYMSLSRIGSASIPVGLNVLRETDVVRLECTLERVDVLARTVDAAFLHRGNLERDSSGVQTRHRSLTRRDNAPTVPHTHELTVSPTRSSVKPCDDEVGQASGSFTTAPQSEMRTGPEGAWGPRRRKQIFDGVVITQCPRITAARQ
ncbi:hypothetical protein C8T65DRAFT_696393 [Cerioporus squamosus]|nr:hypothetical protein C8T65DRAFT_696393 [Cerioporus squamosus]